MRAIFFSCHAKCQLLVCKYIENRIVMFLAKFLCSFVKSFYLQIWRTQFNDNIIITVAGAYLLHNQEVFICIRYNIMVCSATLSSPLPPEPNATKPNTAIPNYCQSWEQLYQITTKLNSSRTRQPWNPQQPWNSAPPGPTCTRTHQPQSMTATKITHCQQLQNPIANMPENLEPGIRRIQQPQKPTAVQPGTSLPPPNSIHTNVNIKSVLFILDGVCDNVLEDEDTYLLEMQMQV